MFKKKGKNGGTLYVYEPGESGNPSGKPKGTKNRATILRQLIDVKTKLVNKETGEEIQLSYEYKVMIALIDKALSGDVNAIKEVQDTLYGKIKDIVEIQKEQPLFPDKSKKPSKKKPKEDQEDDSPAEHFDFKDMTDNPEDVSKDNSDK